MHVRQVQDADLAGELTSADQNALFGYFQPLRFQESRITRYRGNASQSREQESPSSELHFQICSAGNGRGHPLPKRVPQLPIGSRSAFLYRISHNDNVRFLPQSSVSVFSNCYVCTRLTINRDMRTSLASVVLSAC